MGLGCDVNLSPPGLVEDKPGQVSPFPFFINSTWGSCVMETLFSKGSDPLVSPVSRFAEFTGSSSSGL